jgi:1-aminocyclopropane-1-carboxylate deaminase/D-cysteine desulfhydrase-like pyridoxal-dependent ACC family enzyme
MATARLDHVVTARDTPLKIVSQTRIQYSAYLSQYTGGNIYIKREDQQDSIGSGVKIRQIATLLENVKKTSRGPIIIDGVPQSNCVMSLCHYADLFDVPLHVLIKCEETEDCSGNLGRIKKSSAKITWVPDRRRLDEIRREVVADYEARGFDATVVPAGANCDLTVHGPIGLGEEIARQEAENGIRFDHIVLAVASGGTYAGLQISTIRHGRDWQIHAVRTDNYDDAYYQDTYASKRRYLALSPEQSRLLPDRLELYEGATLGGYGVFGAEHARETLHIYDQSGIFFGPTYAFKALIGVKKMVAEGIIPASAATLLIHTGGINEREILPTFIAART